MLIKSPWSVFILQYGDISLKFSLTHNTLTDLHIGLGDNEKKHGRLLSAELSRLSQVSW